MFICEFCGKKVAARVPCQKIVTTRVWHNHPYRPKVHKKWIIDKGRLKLDWTGDPGGWGWQIVVEKNACPECALKKASALTT